ncbi:hypothetical protein IE81DRAFT_329498 [Ceraceosorus guamensis]|uniref:Uncharacterized protein n=1 Tax=Ceraceosorus guamensis TaxID=1522189 RepID=A0A316W0X4_9BASI|nr:hypothetical protein IE81DRAFT_329498 [Ceraceosorus guamensis]PWN43349.1 hypothetical protein IE81DRAFT_329498 [Ceraceosorus guamensis]
MRLSLACMANFMLTTTSLCVATLARVDSIPSARADAPLITLRAPLTTAVKSSWRSKTFCEAQGLDKSIKTSGYGAVCLKKPGYAYKVPKKEDPNGLLELTSGNWKTHHGDPLIAGECEHFLEQRMLTGLLMADLVEDLVKNKNSAFPDIAKAETQICDAIKANPDDWESGVVSSMNGDTNLVGVPANVNRLKTFSSNE